MFSSFNDMLDYVEKNRVPVWLGSRGVERFGMTMSITISAKNDDMLCLIHCIDDIVADYAEAGLVVAPREQIHQWLTKNSISSYWEA